MCFASSESVVRYGVQALLGSSAIDQTGIAFEQNLGTGTDAAVRQISTYDPDDSWQPTHP